MKTIKTYGSIWTAVANNPDLPIEAADPGEVGLVFVWEYKEGEFEFLAKIERRRSEDCTLDVRASWRDYSVGHNEIGGDYAKIKAAIVPNVIRLKSRLAKRVLEEVRMLEAVDVPGLEDAE